MGFLLTHVSQLKHDLSTSLYLNMDGWDRDHLYTCTPSFGLVRMFAYICKVGILYGYFSCKKNSKMLVTFVGGVNIMNECINYPPNLPVKLLRVTNKKN